jgi:hypothetical protein
MSAVMQITIRQGVMIDHVDMMVRDNATLAIQPAAGSSNLSLTLKNDATITVQDSAKAVFQMAPIIPASVLVPNNDQGSYFVIGKGSGGGFLFQVSNGVKPFDGTKKYPAGLFDFKSDADGDNQNKLVIYGIGNAFEFHNMLADKVLAINGTATNNVNLFNIKYAGDHTTVTLLAASADNA